MSGSRSRRVLKGAAEDLCRQCLAVWLVLALAIQTGVAQTALGDWKNVQDLPLGSAIYVTTKSGEKYHGALVNVTSATLTMNSDERGYPGRVSTRRDLPRQEIREVRFLATLASVLAGAAIGAGVGAGIGLGLDSTAKSHEHRGLIAGLLGVLGAAVAAGIAHHDPFVKGKRIYIRAPHAAT